MNAQDDLAEQLRSDDGTSVHGIALLEKGSQRQWIDGKPPRQLAASGATGRNACRQDAWCSSDDEESNGGNCLG